MAIHRIKQGDNARLIEDFLTLNGVALDLTGSTVNFVMKNVNGGQALNKAATIVSAVGGHVNVRLTSTDTQNWGRFYIEWRVTYGDGSVLTVPDDTYAELEIVRFLA